MVGIPAVLGINLGSHFDARWGALFDRPKARQGALRQRESPGGDFLFIWATSNVRFWHLADIGLCAAHVCF